jgi:hypothetical protein
MASLLSIGCQAVSNFTTEATRRIGRVFGHDSSSDPLADAGESTVYIGPGHDRPVELSPERYAVADAPPIYMCIEPDEQNTLFGFGIFEQGSGNETLLEEIRSSTNGLVVGNALQSRILDYRPTMQVITDRSNAERCDLYAKVAVTSVNYGTSKETSDGGGGTTDHNGTAQSVSNTEHMDVIVRVRFFDHPTNRLVTVGHGRARLESKTGSSEVQAQSGPNSGSGSSTSQRSSILSAAITRRLIGQASSATLIDALNDVDDYARVKVAQAEEEVSTP